MHSLCDTLNLPVMKLLLKNMSNEYMCISEDCPRLISPRSLIGQVMQRV